MEGTLLGAEPVTPEVIPAQVPKGNEGGAAAAPEGGATGSWLDSLGEIPKELVTEKIRRFKTPAEFVRSFNEKEKLISSKGYEPPAKDAPSEEWDAFYSRIGRPESPDKYEWEAPEGVELDQESLSAAKAQFHKLGLTPRQFQGIMDFYKNDVGRIAEMEQERQESLLSESQAKLKQEWGDNFEGNLRAANNVLQKLELKEALQEAGLLNDARVAKALHKIATLTAEHGRVDGDSSRTSINDQIAAIRASKEYQDERHPGRQAKLQELDALYRKKEGKA